MAININLNTIASGFNLSKINDNFTIIKNALADVLSRTGITPNTMQADLDLNSNDLLNVDQINANKLILSGAEFNTSSVLAKGNAATITLGTVTTGAAGTSVIITNSGDTHAATFNFTIPKGDTGATGPGTGDLLAAQNLNDLSNKATAFSNIKQAATTGATGVAQLATDVETLAAASTTKVITPSNLAALIAQERGKFTGMLGEFLSTLVDTSVWVLASSGTIGNTGSGATNRANADTVNLYTAIWTATAIADLPIYTANTVTPTTKGVSAAADFAAGKHIAVPNINGSQLFTRGYGARSLGNVQTADIQTHGHTASSGVDSPDHAHSVTISGNSRHGSNGVPGDPALTDWSNGDQVVGGAVKAVSSIGANTRHTHAIVVNNYTGVETRPINMAVAVYIHL